jgi:hypothetical protein
MKPRLKAWVAFAIVSFSIFAYADVRGFDWKYYGTNENGSYFYETETVTRLSQDIVRVCVQSIYTQRGVSHWVRDGGKEFQNLGFSLILSEYNCTDRSIRPLNIRFYSKDGEVFYPIKNDEWHFLAPDSMSGALFEEICR